MRARGHSRGSIVWRLKGREHNLLSRALLGGGFQHTLAACSAAIAIQPKSHGLQPKSHGLQAKTDEL